MTALIRAIRCEWIKRKRSFATLMVIGGSLFTPAAIIAVRLLHRHGLPAIYAKDGFWQGLWHSSWESMAVFFLPMAAILATSLITHIEFRSNAWKQVHTLPISAAAVYVAKLFVILVMMAAFLLLFTAGIYAAGMIPYALVAGVPRPKSSFTSLPLLRENAFYFVDVLPIVAAQFLMSLRTSNVLVPIGAGFMAWVGALAAVSSKAAVWWPYAYTTIHYIQGTPKGAHFAAFTQLHWLAAIAFMLLAIAGYAMFALRPDKG